MISPTTIAWVAGIVEGEGWIGVSPPSIYNPRIKISMSDEDIIARIAALWGRGYRTQTKQPVGKPHYKPRHIVQLTGHLAAGWLMTLLPFLGKRRRATAIQTLQAWRSGGRKMVRPIAKCHPERQHAGQGLCDWCWVQRREELAIAGQFTGNMAKCHPDRPNHGRGFCRPCYFAKYLPAWREKRRAKGTLPLDIGGAS